MDNEQLAELYLRGRKKKNKQLRWAWEKVRELVENNPEEAWKLTLLMINKSESDEALAHVAAGPLENLLNRHGLVLIDRIEDASRKDARVRLALSGAWIKPGVPVFERWYALMEKYGFADGSKQAL
jgi:hypothetical protein